MPPEVIQTIEEDMERTLPHVKLFQRNGPMWPELRNLLLAYSVFWKERPNYVRCFRA